MLLYLGLMLVVVGVVLLCAVVASSKKGRASAVNGSVAVSGDVQGGISNIQANRSAKGSGHSRVLTITAVVVEIVGIVVVIWHALHMAKS